MWFCEKSRWFCLCRFLSRQNVKFCSVVHWKSAIVISNTVTQSFDRKTGISSLVWNHFLFTNPFAADFSVDRHASCNTSINGTIWRQFKNLTHFELCESIDRNDWHPNLARDLHLTLACKLLWRHTLAKYPLGHMKISHQFAHYSRINGSVAVIPEFNFYKFRHFHAFA